MIVHSIIDGIHAWIGNACINYIVTSYGTPICYHLVPAALSGSCTCTLCVNYTCLEAAMVFEGWFGGKLLHACLTKK